MMGALSQESERMEPILAKAYYDNYTVYWWLGWNSFFSAQTDCEVNECYWMIPLQEVFEEASK